MIPIKPRTRTVTAANGSSRVTASVSVSERKLVQQCADADWLRVSDFCRLALSVASRSPKPPRTPEPATARMGQVPISVNRQQAQVLDAAAERFGLKRSEFVRAAVLAACLR